MKKVTLYIDPKDQYCTEIEKFLKSFDLDLKIHDVRSKPLNARQLSKLLGYGDLGHFLKSNGKSGKSKDFDMSIANRDQILELIAEDNDLLQKPIIVSGRLMTFGCDRRTIMNMLQLTSEDSHEECRTESAA